MQQEQHLRKSGRVISCLLRKGEQGATLPSLALPLLYPQNTLQLLSLDLHQHMNVSFEAEFAFLESNNRCHRCSKTSYPKLLQRKGFYEPSTAVISLYNIHTPLCIGAESVNACYRPPHRYPHMKISKLCPSSSD